MNNVSETVSENLDAQLAAVTEYLDGYRLFIAGIQGRLAKNPIPESMNLAKSRASQSINKSFLEVLSGKTPSDLRAVLSHYATDEEKKDEIFAAFMADYSIDIVSRNLEKHFPGADFRKLKSLHDLQKRELSLDKKRSWALGLGAVPILFKTAVPKPVIERYLPISYDSFEVGLFLAMAAAIGVLILAFFPIWLQIRMQVRRHQFIGRILDYTAIRKSP